MKILVTGGREYDDYEFVCSVLDTIHAVREITFVVEGGQRGADRLGWKWRRLRGIDGHTEHADWGRYGGHAGRVRNCKMLRDHQGTMDVVVAFRGGTGTRHMCSIAQEAGIPVIETWESGALTRFFATYKPESPVIEPAGQPTVGKES